MDVFYEDTYPVGARDVDLFGHCRPSAVLCLLQEAATQAAGQLHLSGPEIRDRYGAFWMLARIRYELKRPLLWDEPVTVKTWHRGGKAAVMYREFDLSVKGELVGQALSAWVLAGIESRKLLHLSEVEEVENTGGGSLCRGDTLRKLRLPDGLAVAEERRLHYSDTDINGHVNNTRYADFACDSLHLERLGRGKFVRSFQIGYVSECQAGEVIEVDTAVQGNQLFARGQGAGGDERFDFTLTLEDLPGKI